MTKAKSKKATDADQDAQLDKALVATFPASDAVRIAERDDPRSVREDRRPAELDRNLVEKLARLVKDKQNRAS